MKKKNTTSLLIATNLVYIYTNPILWFLKPEIQQGNVSIHSFTSLLGGSDR